MTQSIAHNVGSFHVVFFGKGVIELSNNLFRFRILFNKGALAEDDVSFRMPELLISLRKNIMRETAGDPLINKKGTLSTKTYLFRESKVTLDAALVIEVEIVAAFTDILVN